MQFMSSTSVNCIEEMRLLMPMLLLPLLLLLLLLAKKFLAISNSNVEKRAVAADRVDGENTLLDSLANCVPRPPSGPQQHSGQCSSWSTGRGGWQGSDGRGGHSHRHARMQDTGHFWAGTADIAYFSAHTQMHRNMQQAGKAGARKGGKGNCNDADNDLKFIKNSKICVAKNMQPGRERKHLPAQKRICHDRNILCLFATVIVVAVVALVLLCSTKNAI